MPVSVGLAALRLGPFAATLAGGCSEPRSGPASKIPGETLGFVGHVSALGWGGAALAARPTVERPAFTRNLRLMRHVKVGLQRGRHRYQMRSMTRIRLRRAIVAGSTFDHSCLIPERSSSQFSGGLQPPPNQVPPCPNPKRPFPPPRKGGGGYWQPSRESRPASLLTTARRQAESRVLMLRCFLLRAPQGRHKSAQGNALWTRDTTRAPVFPTRPVRAEQFRARSRRRHGLRHVPCFSGLGNTEISGPPRMSPGRCPGLFCLAPLGQPNSSATSKVARRVPHRLRGLPLSETTDFILSSHCPRD